MFHSRTETTGLVENEELHNSDRNVCTYVFYSVKSTGEREIKFKQCHLSNFINECFPSKFSSKVCLYEGSFPMGAHGEAPACYVTAARHRVTDMQADISATHLGQYQPSRPLPAGFQKFHKFRAECSG